MARSLKFRDFQGEQTDSQAEARQMGNRTNMDKQQINSKETTITRRRSKGEPRDTYKTAMTCLHSRQIDV